MKRKAAVLFICVLLTIAPTQRSHAVVWVVVQEVLKKVLKALDLAVQQLQNKTIWLQNAQKALENTMTKLQLDEISDWSEKHRAQYASYFQELRNVKEVIASYYKVKEILRKQGQVVQEYRKAMQLFRNNRYFQPEEIRYMETVYSGIMDQSLKNLDQLFLVIKAFTTQMSDESRLAIIGNASRAIDRNLDDLRQFTIENIHLSLQRARYSNDAATLKQLYGL